MTRPVNLLIIGAGPFGLALAAFAEHHQIDYTILGKPMDFWKSHMPSGMYLRSDCEWHLDPLNIHTIHKFLETRGETAVQVEPLSLSFYLEYTGWFQRQKNIRAQPLMVKRLNWQANGEANFSAELQDGSTIDARNVVIALGFSCFKYIPPEFADSLPAGRYHHTCDLVQFDKLRGKCCLIIGGRQSAFEWAALLQETGVKNIHMSYRHDTPKFAAADWSWVTALMDRMLEQPTLYRDLTGEEQETISQRLWEEGRLKLEPWLWPRINKENVHLHPNTEARRVEPLASGELKVHLNNGREFPVDSIILATGYKVNIDNIPFLTSGNILSNLETRNGYPCLDAHFQSSVPGLYITSLPAAQDFGPFFGFTVSVRTSAELIGRALLSQS